MHENPLYYCVNMAKGGLTSKRNTAPSTTITITTKPYILLPLIYFVGTKIIQPTKIEANILIIQNLNQFDWLIDGKRKTKPEWGDGWNREVGKNWTMTKCETSSIPIEFKWMCHIHSTYSRYFDMYECVCVHVRCFLSRWGGNESGDKNRSTEWKTPIFRISTIEIVMLDTSDYMQRNNSI